MPDGSARPAGPSGRRDRLLLLRQLVAVDRGLLAGVVLIQLAAAAAPAGVALATSHLVDRLLATPTGVAGAFAPLAALGAVVLIGRLAQDLAEPLNFRLVQQVDGAHRSQLAALTTGAANLADLEGTAVRELIRRARAEPESSGDRTPGQGVLALLALLIRIVGVCCSAAVLARHAWWLMPLVVVPAFGARAIWRRQVLDRMRLQRHGVHHRLHSDQWKTLATDASGGKEVRTFGLGPWAIDRSRSHLLQMAGPRWEQAGRSAVRQWQVAALIAPSLVCAYTVVTLQVLGSGGPVGAQTMVFTAAWSVFQALGPAGVVDIEAALPPVQALAELRRDLAAGVGVSMDRPIPAVGPGEPPVVRFEGVDFAYPGSSRQVLRGLDLELRPGELLALVGLNGAGKSTLMKLASGLYQPSRGRVTVDGADLRSIRPEQWHRRVAFVFHGFIRYPLSVADNIMLGRPTYAGADVDLTAVAEEAGCLDLIEDLPAGWQTPLSTARVGGTDLSGGQWQQVAFARALYAIRAGAQVVVLDEPTAHLDVQTEFELFARIAELPRHVTRVLISHRLSTVRHADRIAVLDEGRIVEAGDHQELMAFGGRYAEFFNLQAARFDQGAEARPREGVG